jgi:GNAT superfamily N-acetyltransferase
MTAVPDQPHDDLRISTDPAELDLDWLVAALSERAYWALGRRRSVVERSVRHSLCFGAYADGRQVGFARVVTDEATFAWICDVFVDETVRGHGVGKRLMTAIMEEPRLAGLGRMLLATQDAHGLYAGFGFEPLGEPDKWMIRPAPDAGHGGDDAAEQR